VAESRRAYDLSLDKLRQGTIDMTTLLSVEETLFTQEDLLAQVRFARLEAIVSLYQVGKFAIIARAFPFADRADRATSHPQRSAGSPTPQAYTSLPRSEQRA
jgi:hypothetical protein